MTKRNLLFIIFIMLATLLCSQALTGRYIITYADCWETCRGIDCPHPDGNPGDCEDQCTANDCGHDAREESIVYLHFHGTNGCVYGYDGGMMDGHWWDGVYVKSGNNYILSIISEHDGSELKTTFRIDGDELHVVESTFIPKETFKKQK